MFQSATPKLLPGRLGEPLTSTTSPRRVWPKNQAALAVERLTQPWETLAEPLGSRCSP